jgi:RimJ/RimL family protein N-acetyltransferase
MNQKSTLKIRIASTKDANAIAQTHIRSWQKIYKDFIPDTILMNLSLEERTKQWYDRISRGRKVVVLDVENKLIGFASICPYRDSSEDESVGEISSMYLDPGHWRKGYGTKLCQAAIAELEQEGYKKVVLWVLEANIQVRQFYEAMGFKITDTTKLSEFYDGSALLTEVLYQRNL